MVDELKFLSVSIFSEESPNVFKSNRLLHNHLPFLHWKAGSCIAYYNHFNDIMSISVRGDEIGGCEIG